METPPPITDAALDALLALEALRHAPQPACCVIGLTSIVVYGDWKGYAPANSIWMTLIFVTGVLLGAGVHALLGHKTIEDTP
jgi:hypothetical protein